MWDGIFRIPSRILRSVMMKAPLKSALQMMF